MSSKEHYLIENEIVEEEAAYKEERYRLQAEIRDLERRHNQAILDIQKRCESIGHVDDGGFMYGRCKHCGFTGG